MSGRIRSLKPEVLEDAVSAGLSDTAFRLFIAFIVMADDFGNLRAEPALVRGQVYWRTKPLAELDAAYAELEPLVQFYEVNGQRYGHIRNWEKHQKVSHKGSPRVPGPPESLTKPSGDPPESLVPDLRSPITDHRSPTKDLPRAGAREDPPPSPEPDDVPDEPAPKAKRGHATYAQAFAEGQERVTGEPFPVPGRDQHEHLAAMCLLARGPDGKRLGGAALDDWIREKSAEFRRAQTGAAQFGGFTPKRFLTWWGSGRPVEHTPSQTRLRAVQSFDPNDPWVLAAEKA